MEIKFEEMLHQRSLGYVIFIVREWFNTLLFTAGLLDCD